jgi:hypothetical protein
MSPDVLEEHGAFIHLSCISRYIDIGHVILYYTLSKYSSVYTILVTLLDIQQQHEAGSKLAACFMLLSCLAYSSTLKMKVTCSSEMSVDFQWTTQVCMSEDRTFQHAEISFSNVPSLISILYCVCAVSHIKSKCMQNVRCIVEIFFKLLSFPNLKN